jgi:predicted outer membrane protein
MKLQGMILAAAVAVLPVAAAAQAREASDENDRAAHAFLSAVDLGEVQQSMLATQRATNAEVRTFAQQMIGDHTNALHTREMLMQTENSGLMTGMGRGGARASGGGVGNGAQQPERHGGHGVGGTESAPNTGPLPPAYGPGNGGPPAGGSVPEGQRTTSSAPASDNTRAGQLPPAYGPGNGQVNVEQSSAQGQGNGQGNGSGNGNGNGGMQGGMGMGGMPPGVTPEMVQQLMATLAAHPMSRPVMEANARNMQVLQGVNGPQFDMAYMDAQIGAHRYALQNIDRMLAQQGTLGDDITGTLRMMRTAVASHLQMAEQIRARLQ